MFKFLSLLVIASVGLLSSPAYAQDWSTVTTSDASTPVARHESNAIFYNGMIYLIGGRRERPVDRYNPATNSWETIATAPVEMHHFQPVLYNNKIYIIGAFSCCYPLEPTIADIHVFDPADNTWSIAGTMPTERLRGSAGTVVRNDKIYVIGGNTNGHSGGAVPWLDEYDPATGIWTILPDAPTARDHFSAEIIGDTLIATGGRQSANSFAFTVAATDLFDFNTNQWTSGADIPTQRAGTTSVVYEGQAIIIGGESVTEAHATVEAYDPTHDEWSALADMINPRHAGGAVLIGTNLHVFAGSTTRGADGESNYHEAIDLALALPPPDITTPPLPPADTDSDGLPDDDEINIYFTDKNLADSDNDGINDYDEIHVTGTNPNSVDTDSDNINDKDEIAQNLDPNNPDTDNDSLNDGDEISIYSTAPDDKDSDGDGIDDGSEIKTYATDPRRVDSDNDGLSDGIEINQIGSNPLMTDSDNDGLSDAVEFNEHGTNPASADSDADGLTDSDELYVHSTNPISNDSDHDGLTDGDEILIHKSNPSHNDTDGDGVPDGQEIASGSSLTNIDDDNDGIINGRDGLMDSDDDGLPNFADRDSDNDGIPDLVEAGFSDVDFNGQLDTQADWTAAGLTTAFTAPIAISTTTDTDGDGIPDFMDLDSDQDGIPDLAEATSDYSTSATTIQGQTDSNLDGLSDNYATSPADDDDDSYPNHLDLDSDDDGISDLLETGSPDIDGDSLIDDFIDFDGDGLADNGRPMLGKALPDEDNDLLPDLIDSEYTRSGCTLSTNSAGDPLFLALLLLSLAGLARSRKHKADKVHT